MRAIRRFFAVMVLALLTTALAVAQDGPQTITYTYDSAGRLTRVMYPQGKSVSYAYDKAGNLLARRTAGIWQGAVKKPSPAAWVLYVTDTGVVSGSGADTERGFYAIAGQLTIGEKTVTGELRYEDETTGAVLGTFPLEKSKAKRHKKTGALAKLLLKTAKSNPSGRLQATLIPVVERFEVFQGTYDHAKNWAKVGKKKTTLESVSFGAGGSRTDACALAGALEGSLISDHSGKAFGEITYEGTTHIVTSKLKDGAKTVKAKTVKGAPVKFSIKLKRAGK